MEDYDCILRWQLGPYIFFALCSLHFGLSSVEIYFSAIVIILHMVLLMFAFRISSITCFIFLFCSFGNLWYL